MHKETYRYGEAVEAQVEDGLRLLREAISNGDDPFGDAEVYHYYEQWKQQTNAEGESTSP